MVNERLFRRGVNDRRVCGNGVLSMAHSAMALRGNRATCHRIVHRSKNMAILPLSKGKSILFIGRFECPFGSILLRLPTNGERCNRSPGRYNVERLGRRIKTATSRVVCLNGLCPAITCSARIVCVCVTEKLRFNRQRLSRSRFMSIIEVPFSRTLTVMVESRVPSSGARLTVLGTGCVMWGREQIPLFFVGGRR